MPEYGVPLRVLLVRSRELRFVVTVLGLWALIATHAAMWLAIALVWEG